MVGCLFLLEKRKRLILSGSFVGGDPFLFCIGFLC